LKPDVGAILDHDIAVLAAQDRIAADEHPLPIVMPLLSVPFIEAAESSITTLSPMWILCGCRKA
jgi:hypothetical protein